MRKRARSKRVLFPRHTLTSFAFLIFTLSYIPTSETGRSKMRLEKTR